MAWDEEGERVTSRSKTGLTAQQLIGYYGYRYGYSYSDWHSSSLMVGNFHTVVNAFPNWSTGHQRHKKPKSTSIPNTGEHSKTFTKAESS